MTDSQLMCSQVSYDFALFFPSVDAKALHKVWDQLLITPISDWKENVDVSAVPTKDDNVWKFFILFNRFKSVRSRFYINIKSLIVFSKVRPTQNAIATNVGVMHNAIFVLYFFL